MEEISSTVRICLRYLANIERDIARTDPEDAEVIAQYAAELSRLANEVATKEQEILRRYVDLKRLVRQFQQGRRPVPV